MSFQRFITALIGFPLVVLLLIFGNAYIVSAVFSIIAIMAVREFFNAFSKKANPVKWIRIRCSGIHSSFTSCSR